MNKSIMAASIGAVGLLFLSGGLASAKSKGGSSSNENSAPVAAPSSGAHVYSPMAPRFSGTPPLRSHAGQQYSAPRSLTSMGGRHHPATDFAVRPTGVNRRVESGQVRAKGLRSTQGRADKWSRNNRSGKSKLDAASTAKLRNWRGKTDSLAEAATKNRGHRHQHHDRDWWRHHCLAIILVGWGYWGWDAGWWYPAWGYDTTYSSYEYDGPIYGYDGLQPDQVIANVQSALQRAGYYSYAVDGVLGPVTQGALGRFQRDHGVPVTGAIDPPTLRALGFIA